MCLRYLILDVPARCERKLEQKKDTEAKLCPANNLAELDLLIDVPD